MRDLNHEVIEVDPNYYVLLQHSVKILDIEFLLDDRLNNDNYVIQPFYRWICTFMFGILRLFGSKIYPA